MSASQQRASWRLPTTRLFMPALAEHTVFVVSVRNGSQLTGVPWDLRLAGHTGATHTFLVLCENRKESWLRTL